MESRLVKGIIFIWLAVMCSMDYFSPPGWQTRLLMWGMNALLLTVWIMIFFRVGDEMFVPS
ncbi:MAG: hypothetical protein ACMUIA_06335 [bacterium]